MTSLLTVSKAEKPISGRYIVTLKEDVSLATHLSSTQSKIASTPSNITHEYSFINGYAGEFSVDDLNDLRANPEIASIEEDGTLHTCSVVTQFVPSPPPFTRASGRILTDLDRTDATWGLGRITSQEKLTGGPDELIYTYKYDSTAGSGVDVYIIGVFLSLTI